MKLQTSMNAVYYIASVEIGINSSETNIAQLKQISYFWL